MPVTSLLAACGLPAPEGAARPPAARAGLRRAVLGLVAGLLLTAAQPPYGLWPLGAPGWVLAALLWSGAAALGPRQAFLGGWAVGTGFFLSGLWWIGEAFFVDAARTGWMAPFAVLGLGAGLGLFWGLGFWAAARLAGPVSTPPRSLGAALLLTGAMAGVEFARAHVLTGFPWALPGYALTMTPAAQLASLTGPHGLGLLCILFPLAATLPRSRAPRLAAAALGLGGLAAAWSWGAAREAAAPVAAPDAPEIRVVQPNAAQKDKWRPELVGKHLADLLRLSAPEPGRPVPALTLWPETPGPWMLNRDDAVRDAIAAAAGGATVLTGARRVGLDAQGLAEWRNALIAVGADATLLAHYDKHHLVPFGEYMPAETIMRRVGLGAFVGASFGAGPGPELMTLPGLPPFQPQICYETIFPDEVLTGAARPAFIAQSTNDAWFGASAGPRQHFHQARMRAIEQGIPVIRSANTGISAVIDARGRALASLDLDVQGALQAPLPPADPPTLFARTGETPAALAILALLGLGAALARRSKA